MDRDIARLNIDHFHKLLAHETDEAKRRVIIACWSRKKTS